MARRVPEGRLQELIEAATRVFLEQGYRRTQMADVAARLGVAKGTLYLYVESKEALFDAVLRHADAPESIGPPAALPLPTPAPGATLQWLEKRVSEVAALPELAAALQRRRVDDVRAELEAVLHELYRVLAEHRTAIELLDRCAPDYPELAAVWHRTGRYGAHAALERYLADRIRRRRLRRCGDVAVTARIVLETFAFWAVHRHWDPTPQLVDEREAEDTVVRFLAAALLPE